MNRQIISLLLIWQFFSLGILMLIFPKNKSKKSKMNDQKYEINLKRKLKQHENQLLSIGCAVLSYFLLELISQTLVISLPLSIVAGSIPWIKSSSKERRRQRSIQDAWPEALDHVNSAIKSGVPISEALSNLGERGPIVLSPLFKEYKSQVISSGNLELALKNLCQSTQDPVLRRLTQTILLVRNVGGVQVGLVLRTFTAFLRNDLAAKREIEMRHGWISNTARIASSAPWLLLIFLTFQPQTRNAYNTVTGAIVVLSGSLVIFVAYIWMNRSAQHASGQSNE
jgi:tight adherence protein B